MLIPSALQAEELGTYALTLLLVQMHWNKYICISTDTLHYHS